MAKRFIDTEIFNDSWFMDLDVNAKILYIYFFTNCDHAGIIDVNWRLTELQTGIKQLSKTYETLIKQLGNRLYRLKNNYYFLTKYIKFQYPGFPNSKVRQQESAIRILVGFNLFDLETNSLITLNKEFNNSYEHDSVNEPVIVNEPEDEKKAEIIFPWNDERFFHVWEFWKKFKKEQFKFTYKPIGEQAALSNLKELSDGKLETAMLLIKQSIEKGWKGFFPLEGKYTTQTTYDVEKIMEGIRT